MSDISVCVGSERNSRKVIIESVLFVVYSVLTLIGALNHELWIDEAQAWNIARDNDFMGIVEAMRYEGHPPLWHFVLYIFANLGCSWRVVPIISWAFNVVTVALLVYRFPFNTWLKAAIMFSAGFIFYNSVVSRVYCMIPLILCCIALTYPNRKKYPVLYGGFVALLANTHVFMCGIVGALGILMLIDLFKDWKKNSATKNLLNIAGLIVAAVGVLVLVFMVFGSMDNNNDFQNKTFSLRYIFRRFIYSFENIAIASVSNLSEQTLAGSLWAMPIKTLFVVMLLLLLRRRRAFFIEVLFIFFYIIVCEVIWMTLPNRAAIFIFSYAFAAYIARCEEPVVVKGIQTDSIKSNWVRKIAESVSKTFKHDIKVYEAVLGIAFAFTIPIGAAYLIQDYYKDFNAWRQIADYLEDNWEEDMVVVTYSDGTPELSAYLPELKLYSLIHEEYYTYISHTKGKETLDYDNICEELSRYNKVYYIMYGQSQNREQYSDSPVLVVREGLKLFANMNYAEMFELEDKELKEFVDEYNEMQELVNKINSNNTNEVISKPVEPEHELDINVESGIEMDLTLANAVRAELGYDSEQLLTYNDLENITYIGAFEEPITSLEGVSLLTNLTDIRISSGYITDISELNGLQSLNCIDIANCYITEIPDLSDCPMLTTLYLVNNLVEDISVLNDIDSLEYVNIAGNRISSIASIKDVTYIKSLSIDNNCILDYDVIQDNEAIIAAIDEGSQGKYEQFLAVENMAKDIVATFPDDISELELERIIYQYVIDNMEFEVVSCPSNVFGYYGLFDGIGVCGDYAELFCILANHAGLEAYVCSSDTHAWNIVKIDGKYYHCDALWDEVEEQWQYFNRSEEFILEIPDHVYDVKRYPSCK